MRELRFPWLHWHSQAANILPSVLPPDPPLANHPWVTGSNPRSAAELELAVAKPSIMRWTRVRFDRLRTAPMIDDPERVLTQVLGTPSVNIVTSHTESGAAGAIGSVDLPQTFFVDSEGLTEVLGLPEPPPFTVSAAVYLRNLAAFGTVVSDGAGFRRTGDTHFAFAVPERAFEDRAVLQRAIQVGLLTRRLAACLLMTDFPNPVFSTRREALLAHVPATATVTGGTSTFSQEMADAIVAAAPGTTAGSPEREFAARWAVGEDFADAFAAELTAYYGAVTKQLATQDGYDDYVRLAETRRRRVRRMPIFETPLLFAENDVPDAARTMRPDGTVTEG
jgi:hypothetical protein